jgi:AraC-like DNA-binding protein
MPADYPFQLPFIRWADVAVIKPRAPLLPRQLYDHELVYVLDGHGTISIHGAPQPARPDFLFLIQPKMWHAFTPDADSELQLLGVHFDWSPEKRKLIYPRFRAEGKEGLFREAREIRGWDLAAQPFVNLENRREVRRALEAVVHEYQSRDEESSERAGALLAVALLTIERAVRQLRELRKSTFVGPDALRRAERAKKLLETDSQCSIENAAHAVDWSADHLRRIFKAAFHASPLQVQTQSRVARAQHLLRTTTLNIAEISEQCGFYDSSHFSRVFKQHTGFSPRQFLGMVKKI